MKKIIEGRRTTVIFGRDFWDNRSPGAKRLPPAGVCNTHIWECRQVFKTIMPVP